MIICQSNQLIALQKWRLESNSTGSQKWIKYRLFVLLSLYDAFEMKFAMRRSQISSCGSAARERKGRSIRR